MNTVVQEAVTAVVNSTVGSKKSGWAEGVVAAQEYMRPVPVKLYTVQHRSGDTTQHRAFNLDVSVSGKRVSLKFRDPDQVKALFFNMDENGWVHAYAPTRFEPLLHAFAEKMQATIDDRFGCDFPTGAAVSRLDNHPDLKARKFVITRGRLKGEPHLITTILLLWAAKIHLNSLAAVLEATHAAGLAQAA